MEQNKRSVPRGPSAGNAADLPARSAPSCASLAARAAVGQLDLVVVKIFFRFKKHFILYFSCSFHFMSFYFSVEMYDSAFLSPYFHFRLRHKNRDEISTDFPFCSVFCIYKVVAPSGAFFRYSHLWLLCGFRIGRIVAPTLAGVRAVRSAEWM